MDDYGYESIRKLILLANLCHHDLELNFLESIYLTRQKSEMKIKLWLRCNAAGYLENIKSFEGARPDTAFLQILGENIPKRRKVSQKQKKKFFLKRSSHVELFNLHKYQDEREKLKDVVTSLHFATKIKNFNEEATNYSIYEYKIWI